MIRTDRDSRKRPGIELTPQSAKRKRQSPIQEWTPERPTFTQVLEWRGCQDHRAKFNLYFSLCRSKLLRSRAGGHMRPELPLDVWRHIWEFHKDLDESAEVCRDWPSYCRRKWGPGSHERSLNLDEADLCKRLNWVHRVCIFLYFSSLIMN